MARIRTFVAIDLNKAVRERVVLLQETLARSGTEVKWVEPENLHLTLLFLGEIDDRELGAVCKAIQEGCREHAPFTMEVQGAGAFPNERRPRVLWVGIQEGEQAILELHGTLEQRLLDLGCYRRESRPYAPHITLGRVKREDAPTDPLAALLVKRAEWEAGALEVTEVLVMSSELTSQGPHYTVIARGKLGPG